MRGMPRGEKAWVPAGGGFPLTRQSVVLATRSQEPEVRRWGYETLLAAYWKPVYKYLRVRWNASVEDAEDLTRGSSRAPSRRDCSSATTRRGHALGPTCGPAWIPTSPTSGKLPSA